jgi:putative DNA primase/helicase
MVKQITGGDKVTARFLYGKLFEFKPQFKLFLGTNKRPIIRGTDDGIWRRIHLIPFEVTIPPENRDKKLRDKLEAELAGILAWQVQGALQWQEMGGLRPPSRVLAAVSGYRGEMDILARFLADDCIVDAGATVPTRDLYATYEQWCEEEGEEVFPKNQFSQKLTERGFHRGRKAKARFWKGLSLKFTVEPNDA